MKNTQKLVTLYKYLPFSKNEKGINNSLNVVVSNELYFASRLDLNDPYELLDCNNEPIDNIKVVSLTNSYRKKLMWSHYANGHKGICIAIQVPENDVHPIIYGKKPNSIKDIQKFRSSLNRKSNINIKLFDGNENYSIIKDKKWEYEKEYRLVLKTGDNAPEYIVKKGNNHFYTKFKLVRVYLGVKFNQNSEDARILIKHLKKNKILIKQIDLSKNNYSLIIKNNIE